MKRKKMKVIVIFILGVVLFSASIIAINYSKNREKAQNTVVTMPMRNGMKWAQVVRTSNVEPDSTYLFDNGSQSGWLSLQIVVEKDNKYIATYIGKIYYNRLDY